jgi:hypothetical protein
MQSSTYTVATLLALFLVSQAKAQSSPAPVNRYQMQVIPKGPGSVSNEVVALDTQSGHLWKWVEAQGINAIIYLGKLEPGTKPGDIIADRFHPVPNKPAQ